MRQRRFETSFEIGNRYTVTSNNGSQQGIKPVFSYLTMIRTSYTPKWDNISKLLNEPDSLVTVSALHISLWILPPPSPISEIFTRRSKLVSQTCSISPKVTAISQNSIFEIAAKSRVRVTSTCLRFGSVFLCVKMSCEATVRCWTK